MDLIAQHSHLIRLAGFINGITRLLIVGITNLPVQKHSVLVLQCAFHNENKYAQSTTLTQALSAQNVCQ